MQRSRSAQLLEGKTITAAALDMATADLLLTFDAGTRIGVSNNSTGYAGWQANYSVGDKRWSLVAMGGGKVAFSPHSAGTER